MAGWPNILRGEKVLKDAFRIFLAIMFSVAFCNAALGVDPRSSKLNQGTIGLLVSQAELLGDAVRIADKVDHTEGLRVLPILGRGGLQSINDLLFLRGVDVAMVSSDSLAFAHKNDLYTDESKRISYLAKIGNKNVVILARKEFTSLESLAGKRIAIGPLDSDEFVVADVVLGGMGVAFERVSLRGKPAADALASGRIDAAIFSGAASYADLSGITSGSGLHVLQVPFNDILAGAYSPAILSSTDLPGLIPAGTVVETVASALVLAVFDWPLRSERYYKLEKFNRALFANYFPSLSKDAATNFLAAVPGWKPYLTNNKNSGANSLGTLTTTALQ
jgi:uncharacterized protein